MFTLPESAQEVFDKVANHLLTQNQRCAIINYSSGLTCKYRLNGMSCAAGCLIPDDCYHIDMEGDTWEGLIDAGFVEARHSDLIIALQNLHDRDDVEDWNTGLIEIANNFGLSTASIKERIKNV
jgi:hypothetical protein